MCSDTIEIIWGGDVNLGRRQHFRTAEIGDARVFQVPRLGEADLRIFNLECVVAKGGEQGAPKGEGGPYYYRARPEMLRLLTIAGCDIVTTANNHSGDYGPEAVLEQKMWLEAAGIASAGTGVTPEEAFRPVMKRVVGKTIAVFSVDATQKSFAARAGQPGAGQAGNAWLSLLDPDSWTQKFTPLIAKARQVADHVLIAVHWGPNEAEAPAADEIEVGHRLIDAGADAVLGASAHRLQGIEVYRGCPIIHDAGDLLFDSVRLVPAAGGVFALKLGGQGVEQVEFVPVAVGYGFTTQLEGDAARAATLAYAEKCAALGTKMTATATGGMIEVPAGGRGRPMAPALPPGCSVTAVPEDARIDPVTLGPLRLLGLRLGPKRMTRRQMLWVESFWDAEAVPDADYRISFLAVPSVRGQMPEWGRGMDHDPCDWRVPTGTWSPGVIYRDHYGLRPPPIRLMTNVELELVVALIGPKGEVARAKLPHRALPILPSKGAPQFSKANPNYRTAPASALTVTDLPPGGAWTADQIAAVTGGRWIVAPPEGWYVRSVVNGTKHVGMRPGPLLFVAHDSYDRSRHENNTYTDRNIDRHDSLPKYRDQLAGAIVSRPVAGLDPALPQLLVQDPIQAHIELGIAGRARFQGEVFAVTGTVGKSSATAMLLHMLGGPDRVLASIDNYNSRVGAPLTLSSLAPDYRAAIVEVAQSGLWMKRGPVTRLIRPTVSLVTAIGLSQTGKGVSRLEDVAKWKSRIFDGLEGRAVAVVGDHLTCHELVTAEARKHAAEVFTYGKSEGASLRILDLVPSATGHRVELQAGTRRFTMEVPLLGHGMAMNAVAALAALTASGGEPEEAAHSLSSFVTGAARLERIELPCKGGTFEIIDDSWNAEVISMIHALEVLASRPLGAGGRRIAVLGQIVHLGEMGKALHESLAEPVLTSGADHVITHGEEMLYLRELLPAEKLGPHFSDAGATVDYIRSIAAVGDTVMVKGSRRDSDFGEICPLLASALLSRPAAE